MTELYEQLKERPQTDMNISNLNLEERQEVRRIQVRGTTGLQQSNTPGKFTGVFYLDGDKRAAAEVFAEANEELLDEIDFTKRNPIQTSVNRSVYDWILHAMGERVLSKFETVVLEERPDGTEWVIDRPHYESVPNRRYTAAGENSCRVDADVDLRTVFDDHKETVTESDLREYDGLDGDVRQLLDYYRSAEEFDCVPATVDGELAVEKQPDN